MASVAVNESSASGNRAVVKVTDTDANKSNAVGVVILNAAGEILDPTALPATAVAAVTEDAAAAANPSGPQIMARRRDTLVTNEVSAENDSIALNATNKGQLHVYAEVGAGANHIGQVGSPVKNAQVIPVLDTNIYASGDVLFATTEVPLALRTSGGCADLHSICIVDIDDQKPAINLVFLRANTALGAFNAVPDIDDTEVLDVIGIVPIVAGDYLDLGGASVATLKNVGLLVDATTGTSVYVAAYLTAGTPTHTASGLKINFGFLQA